MRFLIGSINGRVDERKRNQAENCSIVTVSNIDDRSFDEQLRDGISSEPLFGVLGIVE